VFLRDVLLWVDMVERIQLLVVFSAHAFFLSGCVVETGGFSGTPLPCLAWAQMMRPQHSLWVPVS
jgi:hypothetical protein